MLLFHGMAWVGTAHAFCGTFVGAPGSHLVNRTSQIVIARQGDLTTLTLMADFQGDLSDFALLIPVPDSLDQASVGAIAPEVVDRLDRYSTPRLVSYTCGDAVSVEHQGLACTPYYLGGCSPSRSFSSLGETIPVDVEPDSAAGTVTVEAEFQVAEYDVVLLAAEGADGLYDWLDQNGFAIPPGGEPILQDYIDSGVHFLAAKVHLDGVQADATIKQLSPLQLRYTAEDWVLPIRIGTISADGEQEVVIYALTDSAEGDVAISNYPEVELEDECMWDASGWPSFGEFYREELRSAQPTQGRFGWFTEYNWPLYQLTQDTGYHCDPCTVEREELYDPGELAELGFVDGSAYGTATSGYYYPYGDVSSGALLTRLRLVYDASRVVDDLALYSTGMHDENRQLRYIEYDRRLEFLFPVCGEGYVETPGYCGDELDEARGKSGFPLEVPSALGLFGLTVAFGARRRKC